jgi:iron complex transport system substrate-binding protein
MRPAARCRYRKRSHAFSRPDHLLQSFSTRFAPDLLLGWPRANRPEECAYLLPDVCTRAEVGRITGRGNTANLESVIALKPDLILDVGSTSATFVSLAERVQQQTNIPYALLDGRFDAVAETYRKLGELTGRQADAEKLARYAEDTIKNTVGRVAAIAPASRPRVYYARGPRGLVTGPGRFDQRRDNRSVAQNVAGKTRAALRMSRSSRFSSGIPMSSLRLTRISPASVRGDPAMGVSKSGS